MKSPTMATEPSTPLDQRNGQASPQPSRLTMSLADLCDGDRHTQHSEVRARFTVAACEYTASPIRNVVVAPLAPGDGSAFKWIDTGDVGIVGVFDPKQLTRKLALTLIGRESGKFLIDIDAPAGGAR